MPIVKVKAFLIVLFIPLSNFYNICTSTNQAKSAMVVSAHYLASQVGVDVMKKGGNAVDAAVAVGFALAVVFPEAGNIGGGGFMIIYQSNGKVTAIDFREKAPRTAWRDMYIDSLGNVTDDVIKGHLSVAVPGTVAGLLYALEKYGTMDRKDILQPSIELAQNGFVVDKRLATNLIEYESILKEFPSTKKLLFNNDNIYKEGDTLYQHELAMTLTRIQKYGVDDFYRGETAQLIIDEMRMGGGLITKEDLENYRVIERQPVSSTYRGYKIYSMSPPSSGGICLFEMLNILENYNIAKLGYHSSAMVHVMAEAMKRVYADRATHLGDPDFIEMPIQELISKDYAYNSFLEIDTSKATASINLGSMKNYFKEKENTTHFSVIDSLGNCVAVTYTINDIFGSKVIVDKAGFFLNNEMDDFSSKPGVPNSYGLVGSYANSIEPEKRPLSSMTPTIIVKNDKPVMILGARGGSKIITAVLQAIINVIDFNMNIYEAINAPRFHHQWLPDELLYEQSCLAEDVVECLRSKGHSVREIKSNIGALEAIFVDQEKGWIYGASDFREGGVALGF